MMNQKTKNIILCLLLSFLIFGAAVIGIYDAAIPSSYTVEEENDLVQAVNAPFAAVKLIGQEDTATLEDEREVLGQIVLLGKIPFKNITVCVKQRRMLIPGGMTFGIRLYTKGVLLVGITELESNGCRRSPAGEAGLQVRDQIIKIDGDEVNTVEDVTAKLDNCNGAPLCFMVQRGEETLEMMLTPMLSEENRYKAGIWIKDNTAGIGTVTYIDPETMDFAGLGHGICDPDTGALLPMRNGIVSGAAISGIVKGKVGAPGEFKGYFSGEKIGTLRANTKCGVFGTLQSLPDECATADRAIPIAYRNEVKAGDAEILCSGCDNCVCRYHVRLSDIGCSTGETRNFKIEITDPALLEMTGGIIQGMSGSPIIQNGKLVGAVTHVLVNDPTRGYGIFIENMLDGAAK